MDLSVSDAHIISKTSLYGAIDVVGRIPQNVLNNLKVAWRFCNYDAFTAIRKAVASLQRLFF